MDTNLYPKNKKTSLKIDWISFSDAEKACKRWHYSKRISRAKNACFGVWENKEFKGAIVFGCGSGNSTNGKQYGLATAFQMAELTRVALRQHIAPVSQMLAICIRLIKKRYPALQLLVSFADCAQNHYGGIYQASGWIYVGTIESNNSNYMVKGKKIPARTLYERYGPGGQSIPWLRTNVDPNAQRLKEPPKHKYIYPLNEKIKDVILKLSKPYPKA